MSFIKRPFLILLYYNIAIKGEKIMKIYQTNESKKILLELAIKKTKNWLGKNCKYSIDDLEKIRESLKDTLTKLDNDKVQIDIIATSCGGSKNKVKVNATSETALYHQLLSIYWDLKPIVDAAKINNLTEITGFDFTKKQIEKYADSDID